MKQLVWHGTFSKSLLLLQTGPDLGLQPVKSRGVPPRPKILVLNNIHSEIARDPLPIPNFQVVHAFLTCYTPLAVSNANRGLPRTDKLGALYIFRVASYSIPECN